MFSNAWKQALHLLHRRLLLEKCRRAFLGRGVVVGLVVGRVSRFIPLGMMRRLVPLWPRGSFLRGCRGIIPAMERAFEFSNCIF